ncbi:putative gnat family protein [Mycena sanguinolenta]|uniref:Putative gnat family protein n=1 Tax=Mycena sanguinolenta TaxID=230812 RepID=A0A8H7CBH3_9AGAR|nr:putative gnat family protein [Mycena sanguinolenta]
MPLELREIDADADFPALYDCYMASYGEPMQPFIKLFFPTLGKPEPPKDEYDEGVARLKAWHVLDPDSCWRKVIDTDTGRIAGASSWKIHRENPFAGEPPPFEATWWPAGSARIFTEKSMAKLGEPRTRCGQRPHVYLLSIFTHPEYRRRGVAQQSMDWGMKRADELGLEMFLEAGEHGRALYETNGFAYVEEILLDVTTDTPDERWVEMQQLAGTTTAWLMWRPVGGHYEEGKTAKPWEGTSI